MHTRMTALMLAVLFVTVQAAFAQMVRSTVEDYRSPLPEAFVGVGLGGNFEVAQFTPATATGMLVGTMFPPTVTLRVPLGSSVFGFSGDLRVSAIPMLRSSEIDVLHTDVDRIERRVHDAVNERLRLTYEATIGPTITIETDDAVRDTTVVLASTSWTEGDIEYTYSETVDVPIPWQTLVEFRPALHVVARPAIVAWQVPQDVNERYQDEYANVLFDSLVCRGASLRIARVKYAFSRVDSYIPSRDLRIAQDYYYVGRVGAELMWVTPRSVTIPADWIAERPDVLPFGGSAFASIEGSHLAASAEVGIKAGLLPRVGDSYVSVPNVFARFMMMIRAGRAPNSWDIDLAKEDER